MFRSFVVLCICCMGFSVARELPKIEDSQKDSLPDIKEPMPACGPNEVYECVNPCPLIQTCEDRALNITCSKNQVCDYLCVCKEGYYRRFEGGECITEIECGPRACGNNERYTHCKPSCSNDTCFSLASQPNCDNQEPCKAGCTCRDGYYREEESSPCKPLCLCSEAQETHNCSAWLTQFAEEKNRREEKKLEEHFE